MTRTNEILNYGQVRSLDKVQTIRLISTVREGFEVYLIVIFFEDGRVDTRSFMSLPMAMKKVNEIAPRLAKYVKVEHA